MELNHKARRKAQLPAVFVYMTGGRRFGAHVYFPDDRPVIRILAPTVKELFARLTVAGYDNTGHIRHPHTSPMWARQLYWQHMPKGTKLMGWSPIREGNEKSEVAA